MIQLLFVAGSREMDAGFLLPIRALIGRGKLLTVRLSQFGDDPQRALVVLAGLGPQFQTVFDGLLL
jgi:hypothetical protein